MSMRTLVWLVTRRWTILCYRLDMSVPSIIPPTALHPIPDSIILSKNVTFINSIFFHVLLFRFLSLVALILSVIFRLRGLFDLFTIVLIFSF